MVGTNFRSLKTPKKETSSHAWPSDQPVVPQMASPKIPSLARTDRDDRAGHTKGLFTFMLQ